MVFDVHLMINNPDNYIENFVDAGANIITVHSETCNHLHRTIQLIKQKGAKAAVALNPSTSLSNIECILDDVDMILIMTVNPGFGGQSYISTMTKKIEMLKKIRDDRNLEFDIQVDGGIDAENIGIVTKAGANVIVSGSAIFSVKNYSEIITKLRNNAWKL